MQEIEQEQIRKVLITAGLKATPQRMVLLAALRQRCDHPTAEALYTQAQPQLPGMSIGTVYTTLESFVQKGIANRVPVAEGAMRYDACTQNHHHIYCTDTSEILDFHDPVLEQLIRQHLERKNIQNLNINSISLQIRGNKLKPESGISYL